MAALDEFLKEQGKAIKSPLNLVFLPSMVKGIADSDNKLKALVKTMADWFFWTTKLLSPLRNFFIGGAVVLGFKAIGDAIKNVVRETGSLAAALQKLSSIQVTQRQLAPFLGGLAAAKQRTAELLVLSSKGPFKFEEIAEANVSLERFTRGAYSSVEATKAVGMAAIASGNGIGEVADAVGNLYQTLREGAPIGGAVDQLRKLGIISSQSADQLESLSTSGASSIEVFARFSSEMENSAKVTKIFSDELTKVTAEHDKASQELKAQFGAPWTASEVQNTKNMTAAMQAIAPTVGRISEGMQSLFGGFNTATTGLTKFAAKNETVRSAIEGVAKAFGVLGFAILTIATVSLPFILPKLFAVTTGLYGMGGAATAAAVALRVLGSATVIGLVIYGAISIAAAVYNQVQATKELDKQTKQIEVSFRKANKEIREQIGNIKTLADQHEALAKAMGQVVSSQDELAKAREEYAQKAREQQEDWTILGQKPGPFENTAEGKAMQKRLQLLEKNAKAARETAAIGLRGGGALTGPEFEAASEQVRRRALAREQQEFEARMQREPGRAPELERERGGVLLRRAAAGRAGVSARAAVAERTSILENERLRLQTERETAEREQERLKALPSPTAEQRQRRAALGQQIIPMIRAREAGISGQMLGERLGAPSGTAIQLAAQAEQIRGGITAGAAATAGRTEEAKRLRAIAGGVQIVGEEEVKRARLQAVVLENEAKILEIFEKEAVQLEDIGQGMLDTSELRMRNQAVTRQEFDLELKRQQAQRLGRSEEAIALENQLDFIREYERLRPVLGEKEAREKAGASVREKILGSTVSQELFRPIASSLQRLGGMAGAYGPTGDPALTIQKRLVVLQETSNIWLQTIATKGDGVR